MHPGYSQQGFALSLGLHISVVAVVAVLAWLKPFENKRQQVFELVPLGGPTTSAESSEVTFALPTPTPQPAPPRPQPTTPPRTPPPAPPPTTTKAPVVPTPPKAPPKPKPEPKPPPEEKGTFQDFIQKHGRPQPRPARTTTTTTPPRAAPRIDTRFSPSISTVNNTLGRADGDPNAGDIAAYLFRLAEAVKAVWIVSFDLEVQVDVDIEPSGRIRILRVSKSSGNSAFDESALSALRTVGSIGPTPRGERIIRTLRFRPE